MTIRKIGERGFELVASADVAVRRLFGTEVAGCVSGLSSTRSMSREQVKEFDETLAAQQKTRSDRAHRRAGGLPAKSPDDVKLVAHLVTDDEFDDLHLEFRGRAVNLGGDSGRVLVFRDVGDPHFVDDVVAELRKEGKDELCAKDVIAYQEGLQAGANDEKLHRRKQISRFRRSFETILQYEATPPAFLAVFSAANPVLHALVPIDEAVLYEEREAVRFWRRLRSATSVRALATVDPRGLFESALSMEKLESHLRRKLNPRSRDSKGCKAPFVVPRRTPWSSIEIAIEGRELAIRYGDGSKCFGFTEAGFGKHRPTQLWMALEMFVAAGGSLDVSDPRRTKAKHAISRVNGKLMALVPEARGKPICYDKYTKTYVARCHFTTGDGITISVSQAEWRNVTITWIGRGTVRIDTVYETLAEGFDDEGRRIAAEYSHDCQRDFSFAILGLADAEGRMTLAGRTLVDLLRKGGSLERPSADRGMEDLCERLERLFEAMGAPFTFSKKAQTWTAAFRVADESGG